MTVKRFFWIGDSTVHLNRIDTWPQCGMGQALEIYLRPGIAVHTHGENGRSTKSFRDEGFWTPLEAALTEGDVLLIQFGHNDKKIEDPTRYVTTEQYAENLLRYANEARAKGALPVLVTPLTRRNFGKDGKLLCTHEGYPDAARALAKREGLPLIDLTAKSRALVEALGDERSREFYMHLPAGVYPLYPDGLEDNTHLRYLGTVVFTGLVAEGLRELGEPFSSALAEPCRALPWLK